MGLFESDRLIADRAEFAEALRSLRHGHLLLRVGNSASGCVLDGMSIYHSFHTLQAYGLIETFDNPAGFPGVEYFKISQEGLQFSERVLDRPSSETALDSMKATALIG